MGTTNSKKIQQTIQSSYKPIRKYYNNFYGQITILQERSTNILYVKCQKILNPTKQIIQYIDKRIKNNNQLFVNIKQIYRVPIDLCSEIQKCYIVMEYSALTVQDQIMRRVSIGKGFKYIELMQMWLKMLQAVKQLNKINNNKLGIRQQGKSLISNDSFLYLGNSKVKVLQAIFADKKQIDFQKIQLRTNQNSELKGYYISPESFTFLCQKQKQKARQIAIKQKSLVFTLGMNFLQCALLSDFCQLYNQQSGQFQYQTLNQFLDSTIQYYGENTCYLLSQMTKASPQQRPTLQIIQQNLKYLIQINFHSSSVTSNYSIASYD